ncbi:hypothetical protein ACH42_05300 [Endozoicomonas sp. (ex Bugula neritina AB1)]|nr:hypothetical protein ACH42_05300 [Endozoicomonas sp. (ex Bugula neritina AB1)]
MNTLHTINKPGQPLQLCLRSIGDNDAILLIEDGAYCLLNPKDMLSHYPIYVLEIDSNARGLTCPDNMILVDYPTFVELTTRYNKTISWF